LEKEKSKAIKMRQEKEDREKFHKENLRRALEAKEREKEAFE
jgi:hypothetical protein